MGIEPRQELVDNAHATFAEHAIEQDRYQLVCGDVFEILQGGQFKFDVVLCLGYFYHTVRHAELMDLIERTGARLVVIDTEVTPTVDEMAVIPSDDPRIVYRNPYSVQLLHDPVASQQMAWEDSMTRNGKTIVGRPSRAAIKFMAEHFGFRFRRFDWPGYFNAHDDARVSMVDYDEGWRDTFYLQR